MRESFYAAALASALALLLSAVAATAETPGPSPLPLEPMTNLTAQQAVPLMTPGINIGNTLENTTHWETGWGQPLITREYVQALAHLGFKCVRLPVAWDTYAKDGQIQPDKMERVAQVVNWITEAHMFCVLNIHWDGGWIDSDDKKKFPATYHTFSPEAEKKFRSYWTQISRYFAGKNEKLIFEALNEESNFDGAGSMKKAYDTLNHVNQLFVDTVRSTGGNNAKRLLIIAGYSTDFVKTSNPDFHIPRDKAPDKLLLSVHYYTPWPFVGMNEDASWGKMARTWGSPHDYQELNQLFDTIGAFSQRNNIPAFIGEFCVCSNKEEASVIRWTSAVAEAAVRRKMVPVLWDTGGAVSRLAPFTPSPVLLQMLKDIGHPVVSPAIPQH